MTIRSPFRCLESSPTFHTMLTPLRVSATLFLLHAALLLPRPAQAGQRRFVYNYETLTAPRHSVELENWITYKHRDGGDGDLDRWEFRHEFEFGVTDRLQLALYVADWQYDSRDEEGHDFRYSGTGVEAVYNLTNPNTAWLGSALYAEVVVGERLVELEGKLLLEKRFGPLSVVLNTVIEAGWEGEGLDERRGEFQQTLGVSYALNKHFSAGAEAIYELEWPAWSKPEPGRFFAGPNVSVRAGRFYGTLAWLWQATNEPGEPDFLPRLIVGFDF